MRKLAIALIGWTALTGCSPSEEAYPSTAAERICQQWRRCDLGAFEQSYATVSECVDDPNGFAAGVETALDLADMLGCDYDGAAAAECLRDIKRDECSDFLPTAWITCEAWVCG